MPRLPTKLILQAYKENPLLVHLIKECRTLGHARIELRWLQEGALSKALNKEASFEKRDSAWRWQRVLRRMCITRGRGKPLQYILGNQPFGELEILCRKGVLIPRPETEAYTFHARDVILKGNRAKVFKKSLRILDLCSGSGCISLLLHSVLAPEVKDLTIVGVDVDPDAIKLSKKNQLHNLRRGLLSPRAQDDVLFLQADILHLMQFENSSFVKTLENHIHLSGSQKTWDVLISNPPYISPANLINGTTSRSVRRYEPIKALVPPMVDSSICQDLGLENIAREDVFYAILLFLAHQLHVKVIVLECGDLEQARRVVAMFHALFESFAGRAKQHVYIWNEGHDANDNDGGARAVIIERYS